MAHFLAFFTLLNFFVDRSFSLSIEVLAFCQGVGGFLPEELFPSPKTLTFSPFKFTKKNVKNINRNNRSMF